MVRASRPTLWDERGSTTATVIVFPVVLLLLMLVLQFALAFHAKAVVTAAAQDGNRAAQLAAGDQIAGEHEATAVVAESASSLLRDVRVDVDVAADGREVTTTVDGDVVRLLPIPGLRLQVQASASGPTETFRPEEQG